MVPKGRGHPSGLQPQWPAQYLEQRRSNGKIYIFLLKPGSSTILWPQPETQSHPQDLSLRQNLHPAHQEPSVSAPSMYLLNISTFLLRPSLPPTSCDIISVEHCHSLLTGIPCSSSNPFFIQTSECSFKKADSFPACNSPVASPCT